MCVYIEYEEAPFANFAIFLYNDCHEDHEIDFAKGWKMEKWFPEVMKYILPRVEAAFHKFDTDGDGFIDWEEFKQVNLTNYFHF